MESNNYKMPRSPYDKANPISRMLFLWTYDFFKISYSKPMNLDDLYAPNEKDRSSKIGAKLERIYNEQVRKCDRIAKEKGITNPSKIPKPSLHRALLSTFKWEFLFIGVLAIINEVVVKLTQPILLGRLLSYFQREPKISKEAALLSAAGIALLNVVTVFSYNHYTVKAFQTGMRARVAVCSLIYRKSLKLSRTSLNESAPGKVVNLLSNDVNRFDMAAMFIHYLWIAPVSAILVMIFLFKEVGISGILGICVVFTVVPLQGYTGKLSAKYRLQTAYKTDYRVRLMDEIISGVQVIKMYAWEKPFSSLIKTARKLELKIVRKNSYVRAVYMSFLLFTTRAAIYCTMATMILLGVPITASKVFVFAQYFTALSTTMSAMFVRAITETSEVYVSMNRLEDYLNQDEYQGRICARKQHINESLGRSEKDDLKDKSHDSSNTKVAIKITKGYGRWLENAEEKHDYTLSDINLEILKGKLVGIIGPVGSGKSSLLQVFLGELTLEDGTIEINGDISYASQESWVFGSSVKQNILFGQPYHKNKYNDVVRVCSLQKDFQQLPHGDETLVGDKGASLSGGQKARINLARAVYRDTSIYLLDDPLSAVDAAVGRWLYERCISGYLRHKTRLLVTHQLHHLKGADYIIVMNNGRIEKQGTYKEIASSNLEYASLLTPDSKEEEGDTFPDNSDNIANRFDRLKRSQSRKNSFSSLVSLQSSSRCSSFMELTELSADPLNESDQHQIQVGEGHSKDAVKGSIGMVYVKAGAGKLGMLIILAMFVATQTLASLFDYFVSYWSAQEELRQYNSVNNITDITVSVEQSSIPMKENTLIIIGGCLVLLIMIVGLTRAFAFYDSCIRASQKLHDSMFRGIIRSPMKFFDDNPSGRIMNRVSKDMGAVDEILPKAFMDASQFMLTIVGGVVLASIVNPLFLLVIVSIAILFYIMRKVYLRSSKNIKRMEGVARSPVFTHLGATLQGLTTVRACGAQDIITMEFDQLQDMHTSAYNMFLTTSGSFGFCLDVLCLLFVCMVVFNFFIFETGAMADKVGLAITQAISITFLMQYGIRQSAEVANQLMAVERLQEYTYLKPEKNLEPDEDETKRAIKAKEVLPTFTQTPKDWPETGKIEFKNVCLKYGSADSDPYVLKKLNCIVQGKEKIGIVGRTGAGKSSLIQAMFRLANVEGEVLIDGINTGDITLETLRKHLSIIPQDPILFSGTLRRNLDPFEEYSDTRLWEVLDEVELRVSLSNPAGLEMNVMDGGANFSVGQRQLICLARALLRHNRILMMDEATANVDPHTDNLIQITIRTKFANCTVLTIAHRLNTIMDSDKVLVMDFGEIVEFDHPYVLLQKRGDGFDESGYFYKMVMETGIDNFNQMEKIAEASYRNKHQ